MTNVSVSRSNRQGVESIPLFPLSVLLYPGSQLELRIFESRYLGLVERCLETGGGFGVVRIEEGVEALHEPDARQPTVSSVGTIVEITNHVSMPNGQMRISVLAGQRFEVLSTSEAADRLLMGHVSWLHDETEEDVVPELDHLRDFLRYFVCPDDPDDKQGFDIHPDNASEVSWWLARRIVRDAALGQRILSANSPLERLRTIDEVLAMQGGA